MRRVYGRAVATGRCLLSIALILLPGLAAAQVPPVQPMCGTPPAPCTAANPFPVTGTITAAPSTGTGGQNAIDVPTVSGSLLAARTAPKYALAIKNEAATATIAICFGACTAALNTKGSITIPAGGLYSASPAYIPLDQVNGITNLGSASPATIQSN